MRPRPAILDALPHRPPFRFISEVVQLTPGVSGEAAWEVTGDEAFLTGHFPGRPVVPGVLIVEALAQLSGLVACAAEVYPGDAVWAGDISSSAPARAGSLAHVEVRFKHAVTPPARLALRSTQTGVLGAVYQFDVEATCAGRLAARGRLMLAFAEGAGNRELGTGGQGTDIGGA